MAFISLISVVTIHFSQKSIIHLEYWHNTFLMYVHFLVFSPTTVCIWANVTFIKYQTTKISTILTPMDATAFKPLNITYDHS